MLTTRRTMFTLAAGAGAMLAGCSGAAGGAHADGEDASDMALGDTHAPLHLIEYASITCPHCREFHDRNWAKLKAAYIDPGKVRFVFREFPTNPEELAVAGFQVARCGGRTPAQYFTMLDVLFDQQIPLFDAYGQGAVKDKLLAIAKSSGLSEQQFNACIADPDGVKRIQDTVQKGETVFKVTGTPTFILNGEKLDPKYGDYAELSKLLDSKLAKKGA
jgi:protein-disulfide isomerase